MSISFTPQQQEFVKFSRNRFVEIQEKIDALKAEQKDEFEALFTKLGYDPKISKEKIKSIKTGFKLFYQCNAPETQKIIDDAIVVNDL